MFHIMSYMTMASFIASMVCNILPKPEVFDDYPRVKKAYKTTVTFIAVTAGNIRLNSHSANLKQPLEAEKKENYG